MFVCKSCGEVFNAPSYIPNTEHFDGSIYTMPSDTVCPFCGSDDYEQAIQCDYCKEYFHASDREPVWNSDGHAIEFCPACRESALKSVLDFVRASDYSDYLIPVIEENIYREEE